MPWQLTWKTWAPHNIKLFHWLAHLDRCWTAERLQRRGLPHHARCLLCDQDMETMQHLMIGCGFSRQVWFDILAWLRATCRPPDHDDTLIPWWSQAKQATPKAMRRGRASMSLLIPWMVWKQRNDCVFNVAAPSINDVTAKIQDEPNLWARAGALGLRAILPST
ncbi:uncharacterized protein [Lolium perenne]|uniref:uncharacterized protein n=1 Tax=Lolium perenne TaxID=4522 RepID=UPI003A9950A7